MQPSKEEAGVLPVERRFIDAHIMRIHYTHDDIMEFAYATCLQYPSTKKSSQFKYQ